MGPLEEDRLCRCFVTSVVVDKPEWNRFAATVHYKQDHGGQTNIGLTGTFQTANGHLYRIGDVISIAVQVEGGYK